jgi:hypothetical protein
MSTKRSSRRRDFPVEALLGVLLLVGLLASACGRDYIDRTCSDDSECEGERVCAQGVCADPEDVDAGDAGDTEPDGMGTECRAVDDKCMRRECSGGPDASCMEVACPVDCEPWAEQSGCECEPTSCDSREDCDGYACNDGACGPCENDEACGPDQVCQESGICASGPPCQSDADCPARQKCGEDGDCVDRDECVVDDDCEDDEICFNGQCNYSPECESDSDCREGMECVGEQCYDEVCRGHDDCEGDKLCDAGECIEPPSATRCFVATQDAKISENQRIRLEAFAVDGEGNGVSARFDWSSSNSSVASISATGNFAVGGSSSGTTDITAQTADGQTECDGSVTLQNLGQVSTNKLRVVVTSTRGGSAVSGATVALGGGMMSAQTNGSGVATLPQPSGAYDVSIFHPDYNWVTIQDVTTPDLRIPLNEKEGTGPVAGFQGQFNKDRLHTSGDITLGMSGTSFSGGLLEVGLTQLLGQPFDTQIQTPQGQAEFPLPSGLIFYGKVLGFDLNVKKTYYATGPGGPRLAWGLAGEVPGTDLIEIFQDGGQSNPLAVLLPLFNRFDHAAKPMVFNEMPRVSDSMDVDGDGDTMEMVPNYNGLPKVDLRPSVRQNLVTEVSVSNFPKLNGGDAEFAVLLGGNLMKSAGLVPLGISATTDEDGDGFPDVRNLSMAPSHGAITGGRYAVMALAFRTDGLDPQSGLELPDDFSAALWTKQSLPKKVGLGTFPNATTGTVDVQNRTVDIDADAGPLYRLQFVGQKRTWEVWTAGPMGSMGSYQHTVQVPQLPGGRTDLFANGDVLVDAIQVRVTVNDLVKATGVGLRDVGLVATSFNRSTLK